jgi:hypothetical protein
MVRSIHINTNDVFVASTPWYGGIVFPNRNEDQEDVTCVDGQTVTAECSKVDKENNSIVENTIVQLCRT